MDAKNSPSDQAVLDKTGKCWQDWFAILDQFDGPSKSHAAMAKFLAEQHSVSSWWSQEITVQFERARGLRGVNERSDGFAVSVSRTVSADLDRCWSAWAEADELNTWFTTGAKQDFREGGRYENNDKDAGVFLKIVPQKRLKFTWEQAQHKPGSFVDITFSPKPSGKTAMVLSHEKLASKEEVENLREGWSWAMDSLKSYLETGRAIRWDEWKQARG